MSEYISPSQLANRVLKEIEENCGEITFPIDPFKLLKEHGILVAFSDFEKLEGIILNDDDNVTLVGINRLRPWARQRFSAAHEYCHFLKDLKRGEEKVSRIDCLIGSKSLIEKYADDFASHLLMPTYKLKELCDEYKDAHGFVSFESITHIAEFFGVSFSCCLYRVAYELDMIDGDIDSKILSARIRKYKPDEKRKILIEKNNDFLLIGNAINSMSYCMVDLEKNTGAKFLNNYIYNDNKLEGVEQENVPYILADLSFNGIRSKFYESTDENVAMTIGNFEMQKYVLTTDDIVSIGSCRKLHKLLYSCTPYPEYSGIYRKYDAVILGGTMQPSSYYNIESDINELDDELTYFVENSADLSISEYVERVVYFVYRFIKIHPFADGNGRVSRALLNWLLRLKKIPPIYIDDNSRDEYYNALSKIDLEGNYLPFILLIEKRIINTMIELHDYLFMEDLEVQYVA